MAFEDKRTWAEIDLARLEENYREIRRVLPAGCRFAGLCKANSYGHGAVQIARRLEALGAEYIAVSCYEEALDLRQSGIGADILILAPSPAFLAPSIASLGCTQTIGDIEAAREMSRLLSGAGKALRCQLKLETGMGRTGELFAMIKYGVTPDIVCLAKAFGGGMPLGAFVSSKRIMDTLQTNPTLGHITTFGGHPVCCAAGLAAFDYLVEHRVVEQVEAKGALYEELLADHPQVREIRRSGLLLAVELGSSEKLFRMMELFKQAGILSDWFLYCDTAFRISPPLTISEEEVRDSARIIRTCLDRL